jgi:predicted outer membrane repeat protein
MEFTANSDPHVAAQGGTSSLVYVRAGATYPMNGSFSQPFATLAAARAALTGTNGVIVIQGDGGPLMGLGNSNLSLSAGITIKGTNNARIDLNYSARWAYIYANGSSPLIMEDVTIENGFSSDGGAVSFGTSNAIFRRCRFLNNSASDDGGAIYCGSHGQTTLPTIRPMTKGALFGWTVIGILL